MRFMRNLPKNPQVNPQEKLKILVMAGLATRKVGAEPALAQASWEVAPPLSIIKTIYIIN